eukprot:TRINITY_DN152_c0_g1_i1.p1 TRINITY_DN152_c0_g1~~TRINITY_DN152_c0_g1_i1.p1  ORF type:complete len:327 (+),score=47.33 TRINITY_DN152_c0_g1_i1:46-981(+)
MAASLIVSPVSCLHTARLNSLSATQGRDLYTSSGLLVTPLRQNAKSFGSRSKAACKLQIVASNDAQRKERNTVVEVVHAEVVDKELPLPAASATPGMEQADVLLLGAFTALGMLANAPDALAAGGQFGLLEGRSAALLHPALMFFLFGTTAWAGWLGWQWRTVRTLQTEINDLKATLPATAGADAPPSPVEKQIADLTQKRKELIAGGYRDRHFNVGSLLLGLGVATSVGGCLNTFARTGKLFPGPHLFAGAGITVLWALASACVPAMQKGNETARSLHIALNSINLLLFVWQIPTGLEIVGKVFEFTTWP